jgi:hypothetical protein
VWGIRNENFERPVGRGGEPECEGAFMTDIEQKRMLRFLQTVECLFSENMALKAVLRSHRVAEPVWRKECDDRMNDPELSPLVRAKFQHLYREIEQARDESKAFAALLKDLPKPRKAWS